MCTGAGRDLCYCIFRCIGFRGSILVIMLSLPNYNGEIRCQAQSKRNDRESEYESLSNFLSQFKGSHSIPKTDFLTLKSENIETYVG